MRTTTDVLSFLALTGLIFCAAGEAPAEGLFHHNPSDTPGSWRSLEPSALACDLSKEVECSKNRRAAYDFSGTTVPIQIYQRLFSDLRERGCQFDPSCSEYSKVAIRKHGLLLGSVLAADRLNRCNIGARRFYRKTPSGRLIDPVPGTAGSAGSGRIIPSWFLPSLDFERAARTQSLGALAGSERDILEFAFSLRGEGDHFRAITEFKRAEVLFSSASLKALARFYVAESLFATGDWSSAKREYTRVMDRYPGGPWANRAGFMRCVSNFNLGDHPECRSEIEVFKRSDLEDSLSDKAYLISGLSYLEEGWWRSGSTTFEEALSVRELQGSPYPFEFLARESLRGEGLPGRSGFVAAFMSAVLPGAGQIYSGRFWDGFRAFTVNGLLIFSTYKLVEDEHYAGAYLLSGITLPFYVGNVVGAHRAADAYNVRQRNRFIDSLVSASRPAGRN